MSHGYDMRQFTRQPDGAIRVSHIPTPLEAPGEMPNEDPRCACRCLRAEEEIHWNECCVCGKVIR